MSATPLPERALPEGTRVVADLHLDPAGDARCAGFAAWLDGLAGAPLLVVLGDLFDAWVGPAHQRLSGAREVLAALARLAARGTALVVVPGNRDFLLDAGFERESGAHVAHAGLVGRGADGARVLLVHGDELCTRDHAYQRLRRVLRSRPLRWLAPRVPLFLTAPLARRLRRASVRAVAAKPAAEKAMQPAAVRALAARHAAGTVVCGHAHEARDERLPDGPRWIVLDAFGGGRDALAVGPGGALALAPSGAGGVAPRRYGAPEPLPSAADMRTVTIDGPAGAGKSTVARALAQALGLAFLDTGAMYRAVALEALERGVDPDDEDACARLAGALRLAFDAEGRLSIDGRPAEPAIRAPRVDAVVSQVAAHPGVRRALVPQQRAAARALGGVVAEGRDVGTVVFPDAAHKFFLVASPAERARRRVEQRGGGEDAAAVQAELQRRDDYDATRADSPLRQAEDAVRIDTEGRDAEAVVALLLERVHAAARG